MNYPVLIAVLIYEFITIVGVGMYLSAKARRAQLSGETFILANRDLPTPVVAVTLALTVLGTAHILGVYEMTWGIGAVAIWFSLAHVILLTIACLATGRWVRRIGVSTIPELTEILYDRKVRLMVGCVMAPMIWGILTLETQGVGIIFATMTGWTIKQGAIVGGILGLLYVLLAGMKEVGWVNLINSIIMYAGVIIATIYLATALPYGWDGVSQFFIEQDKAYMLSIFGTWEIWTTFAIGLILSVSFSQAMSQNLMQPAMSAKDEQTVKKALWIAAPVNGLFGVFAVAVGLAAQSIPEYAAAGPKMAATTMLINILPGWLVVWLIATFLGAILSTFAMGVLTPATIFVKDIWVPLYRPHADEKEQTRSIRIVILILGLVAMGVASYLPPIMASIAWLFGWVIPVFWVVVFGLFWKRSVTAAILTLISAWVLNAIWSFTSIAQVLHLPADNTYAVLFGSLVGGIVYNLICKGAPGYFKSTQYLTKYNEIKAKGV